MQHLHRPPPGVFKIVLATNVAETSITIDDVSFVVDTGRAKEMQHDADRGILRLQEQWVSQASAQQRRGRAGRVRPGLCFRMFSRRQFARMDPHTAPEMLRSPLESVCLTIRAMITTHRQARQQQLQQELAEQLGRRHPGKQQQQQQQQQQQAGLMQDDGGSSILQQDVRGVLRHCLSPPPYAAVEGALTLLRQIGALDAMEELTALGHHLTQMPMDPRVGKMLVYGAMLACLDPVLTIAAAMAHGRPVFMSP
ncbi:P-loop containing nucleoside triphosphate hydrolase protein, partial [Dunaliella salina]